VTQVTQAEVAVIWDYMEVKQGRIGETRVLLVVELRHMFWVRALQKEMMGKVFFQTWLTLLIYRCEVFPNQFLL
jgi:hypothetical protein